MAPPQQTPVAPATTAMPDPLGFHEKLLREATDSIPADIGVTTRLERGNAPETILRIAAEDDTTSS